MKTHALDLLTLVESLDQHSALLNTPILDTLPGFVGPCRGWVQVQDGMVATCVLEGVNGDRMEGEPALSLLCAVQEWQVTLEQDAPHPLSIPSTSQEEPRLPTTPLPDLIPRRRVAALSPALLAPLSSKERMLLGMVFTMVNGRRSTQQIKAELHVSAHRIDHAFHRLWTLQMIDYSNSSS